LPLIHFSTNLCLHVIIWQAIDAIPATELLLVSWEKTCAALPRSLLLLP